MCPSVPATDSEGDREAARHAHGFFNAWFLTPALHGYYPDVFVGGAPLGRMDARPGDMETIQVPLDYVGINLYMREIVRAAPDTWLPGFPVTWDIGTEGPHTDFGWEVWPDALYDIVTRVSGDHGRPVIEICENGAAYNDRPGPDGRVHDTRRIAFYEGYLAALGRAMAEGARVRAFHAWSLLDNFEWAAGYAPRFGLVYVDYDTQHRIVKDSGRWFADLAATGRLSAAA
jgi:beta-glucosidase